MKVQDWLRSDSKDTTQALENLHNLLGIKNTCHPDGRVILNYDMRESPKTHEVVRECRGLTLDINNNWDLVARSFDRFFNLGEYREEQDNFDWDNCWATDKADGSLFIIFYWRHEWRMQTRGSFADGMVGDTPMSWVKLAELALPTGWRDKFDARFTYVGELCSAYNRIVTYYPEPKFFLLTMFKDADEIALGSVHYHALPLGLDVPHVSLFKNADSVVERVNDRAKEDATYEGVVLDDGKIRIKVKSASYVALHRMASNGALLSPKNMINVIMSGEMDEVLTYYPELRSDFDKMESKLEAEYQKVDNMWFCYHDEKNQKRFALAVKDSLFSAILFTARNTGKHPREVWDESQDLILKKLFK